MKYWIIALGLSLLVGSALAQYATRKVATWTGQMRVVHTPDFREHNECQYVYNGHYFWRAYDACPASIEIQ
jgi:hypothetical protein